MSEESDGFVENAGQPKHTDSNPLDNSEGLIFQETPPGVDVKKQKGPVLTTLDEFDMRITYDFYQRAAKLPEDKLENATALKVHLFGSLSATSKGHGAERAALAGLVGKEPATVDPFFLDSLGDKPDQTFEVKLGPKKHHRQSRRHHLRRRSRRHHHGTGPNSERNEQQGNERGGAGSVGNALLAT